MIDNPRKVKDLIKNLAKGDSGKAQLLQRRYAMERFLERVAESDYKHNLVLKGGMLVTSMFGIGERTTRDADVTMLGRTLDLENAVAMAKEIASIPLGDGMSFAIEDAYKIMEDSEYGGVCILMRAYLDKTEIPMKLDISTGDALTPSPVKYTYPLLLEDRTIEILAYNIETVLAEKIDTILTRAAFNSRMRDFYDVWVLTNVGMDINYRLLGEAISSTMKNRGHDVNLSTAEGIIEALAASREMQSHWEKYQPRNDFASEVRWKDALSALCGLLTEVKNQGDR